MNPSLSSPPSKRTAQMWKPLIQQQAGFVRGFRGCRGRWFWRWGCSAAQTQSQIPSAGAAAEGADQAALVNGLVVERCAEFEVHDTSIH